MVVGIALAGFAASFVAFGDAAREGCVLDADDDPAYDVQLPARLPLGRSVQTLQIRRDGDPVTGAWACLRAETVDGPPTSVAAEASEAEPGGYEVTVDVTAAGEWEGVVLVDADGGSPEAAVPVRFTVAADDG